MSEPNWNNTAGELLNWVDARTPWQFVAVLYAARWAALAPILALSHFVFSEVQKTAASMSDSWREGSPLGMFVGLVIIPPLLETLVECTFPYWVISRIRKYRENRPRRCWGFVAVSSIMMAVLHPIAAAVLPALLTGAFLAYCYAHFAPEGVWRAILATACFHGAINIVGWSMLVLS